MMKWQNAKWSGWFLIGLVLKLHTSMWGQTPNPPQSEASPHIQAIQDYWFDGAEICRYSLQQSRYGEEHMGSAEFIFVTEPFLTEAQVKHEYGSGASTPVLKLNALRTFNTGIYAYRTMQSIFSPIALETWPTPLKMTVSVQDWCGQAYAQLNHRNGAWEGALFSYFQKEGDRTLALKNAWLEEGLWTTLRLSPEQLPQGEFLCIPSSLYIRFRHIPYAAHKAEGTLNMSGKLGTYTIEYPELGRKLKIHFESKFPFKITGWRESQRGEDTVTVAKLTHRLEHQYYWSQNKPGDAKLRKKLGLKPTPE